MKTFLKMAASVLALATFANAYIFWNYQDGLGCISPGVLEEDEGMECGNGGPFFAYDDNNDGGLSSILNDDWPEASTEVDVFGPYLATGPAIRFEINHGALTYEGFAGVGFKLLSRQDPIDIRTKAPEYSGLSQGLSVSYASQAPMTLELGSIDEAEFSFAAFAVTLMATGGSDPVNVNIPWGDFTFPVWGTPSTGCPTVTFECYMPTVDAIKFKYQDADGTNNFYLYGLGAYGDGGNLPILNTKKVAGFNIVQNGRTLSFGGKAATIEVVNMQGVLVYKGSVSAANNNLNLANLSAGVYVIRAKGEMNFTHKIMLK